MVSVKTDLLFTMISSSDRIFKDLVENTRLGQDKELVQLLKQNQNARTPLFEEVESLIRELNLVEYKVAQQIAQNSENSVDQSTARVKTRRPLVAVDETAQKRLNLEIRNLTRAESSTQRTASAPAVPTISNFRVNSTVTNLENQDYTPVPYKTPQKGSIKLAFERYKTGLKSPNARSPHKRTPSSQTVKASRRSSLVGEVLPEYIRKQLVLESRSDPDAETQEANSLENAPNNLHEQSSKAEPIGPQLNKQTSIEERNSALNLLTLALRREAESSQSNRFKNILVNSLSLYVRKDDSTSASQEGLESGVSETDKEYILPSLFTRSIEDIGGPDVLMYNNSDEDEEEEAGDDDDADDDEYLFKI